MGRPRHRFKKERAPIRTILDHKSYPHIMDMVVGFATIPSLIALRATSRSFRDKVDNLILVHAAVVPESASAWVIDLTTSRHTTLPARAYIDWLPYCPRKVKILDFEAHHAAVLSHDSAYVWASLHTVRRLGDSVYKTPYDLVHPVRTAVDFLDLSEIDPWDGAKNEPLWINIPPSCEYVLHVRWSESDDQWRHIIFRGHAFPRTWTIVFWPCRPGTRPVREFPVYPHFFHPLLLGATAASGRQGQLTLVGVEKINPVQLGGGLHDDPEDRKRVLFTNAMASINAELVEAARLVPWDEWSGALGDRREIIGEWPPEGRVYLCTECRRTAMTAAVFQHTSFPHLLDNIISHAPPPALRALRATSREYRDRVDALPLSHVVFFETAAGPRIGALRPTGILEPFRPFQPFPVSPGNALAVDVRTGRSIDKVAYGPMAEGFTSVSTLRRVGPGVAGCRFNFSSVTTLIDFIDLAAAPSVVLRIPPLVARYVVHLALDGRGMHALASPRLGARKASSHVGDWVVVIHPSATASASTGTRRDDTRGNLLAHLVYALRRNAKVTIVGLEQLRSQNGEYVDAVGTTDILEQLFRGQIEHHPLNRVAGLGEHPLLRFVGLREWWDELGGRAKMEGYWPAKLRTA
ncbi:uncharacterized protein LOC62_04G005232 [Vanrija pseudolonga]|uniref:Uncharacterized protein n=1 Tax=Vanrija pseudolonga TaxID=143232 RepID=A0AAF0Y875_9TREE|nr:hypothetical protein LOC62_04G005232 [Vanrija pseudolonga]